MIDEQLHALLKLIDQFDRRQIDDQQNRIGLAQRVDHAEDKSKSAKPKTITPPNAIIEQVQAIQSRASVLMENWYDEASIIKDAHNNVFAARGWDSEADQFTLQLINQITDISPMQNQEREELFIRAYQDRLGLSDEQAQMLGDEMRQESMRFTMQHFTELLPIASEIISTRSQNKPFTAEMVQRWSQKLEPLMNDALESVNRVRGKLEATMPLCYVATDNAATMPASATFAFGGVYGA